MEPTAIAASVVRAEPGAFEKFVEEVQDRSYDERGWHEGRPADIQLRDGVRVLTPTPYERSWNTGRLYPLMTPMVDVERELSSEEAASWLAEVSSCALPANPAGRVTSRCR